MTWLAELSGILLTLDSIMLSVPSACPFCNAELPALTTSPTTPQTACPRCGEPVASDRFAVRAGPPPGSPPEPAPPNLEQRKRRTLRVLLGVMLGMATVALVFALMTQRIRRERDPKPRVEPPEAVEVARRPAELLGLGFLPNGSNVAVGVHVAQLMHDPAGEALLKEPPPALFEPLLSPLALAGLSLKDVDHIVAGSEVKTLGVHITTVIVTRKPYDRTQLKQAVERSKVQVTPYRKGDLYRFTDLPQLPKLWSAGPRVLVYTTLPLDEVDRISTTTREPADTLTSAARKALTERVSKQSRLWAVGDLGPAKELIDFVQGVGVLPKDQARLLTLVRSFAFGVESVDAAFAQVHGDFFTGSPAGTQEIGKLLEGAQLPRAQSAKVETPPPGVDDAEAQWVSWQVRTDTDALRDLLGRLPLGGRAAKKGR
jgi:hypothetical protein